MDKTQPKILYMLVIQVNLPKEKLIFGLVKQGKKLEIKLLNNALVINFDILLYINNLIIINKQFTV